jgi:hypothetical protein
MAAASRSVCVAYKNCWQKFRGCSGYKQHTDVAPSESQVKEAQGNEKIFKLLANHETPYLHSKILHRCDKRKQCRSGNRKR